MPVQPFVAVAIQPEVITHYFSGKDPRIQRMENVRRYAGLIDRFVPRVDVAQGKGAPRVGLVVFPESFIHGFGMPPVDWQRLQELAIDLPGDEVQVLAQKARQYGIYIAGSAFEHGGSQFPGKIFNTGFIIDPDGKIALKYRKINTSNNPRELCTSPHDVWDSYSHDPEVLFPVLQTPYGNFGMYICFDANFPEVARCTALNGAEVLIRPNNWPRGTVESLDMLRMQNRLRAYENACYLVTCNWAASPLSEYEASAAHAMIVDYKGQIVTERLDNTESYVQAAINVNEVRALKERGYRWNFIMGLRTEIFATAYSKRKCFPANKYLDRNANQLNYDEKWEVYREALDNLKREGIFRP